MFKPNSKPMDPQHALSLILHGCKFADDLEAMLGDLANQPQTLSKACDDIINIFATSKERLNNAHHQPLPLQQMQPGPDPSLQEWLKYGVIAHAMGKIQAMDVSDSGKGFSSSSQRSHTSRKDGEEKRTMREPAPQIGNTDVPPEDNYTWRKYGQKEILGSRYPRAYYKCTHQKMYNCPAKKQVQRLDNDFNTFEVTYIGQHTCHMSSTAPSIAPPDQMVRTQAMVSQPTLPPPSVTPSGTWLSMEFSLGSGLGSSSDGRRGGDAGASAAASGGGATTGSRYGSDVVDYPVVADMADAMFNSGSSRRSNIMDFIFPRMEDKWEAGDKEN
ncbi:WRKY transcription factor 55-like isoform X2 [Hibiscus syriacus]|uniref:WRKY transcription factor 55-like isoform X2 n=1 Tax=Hibiscus syriacus TaxID=106335 RepID=UPI001921EC0A|nr:WRKY transcription factor 55-like isoform X2 [Hibiscus syriacus]